MLFNVCAVAIKPYNISRRFVSIKSGECEETIARDIKQSNFRGY
jgi:hypothetical protein